MKRHSTPTTARTIVRSALVFLTVLITSHSTTAQTQLLTRDVITGLDTPWEILWGPDDWIWLTERPGRVSRVNPATGDQVVLLTIPDVIETDNGGLLGMTLHPDFVTTPHVFLVYTYQQGDQIRERLVRYTYQSQLLSDPLTLLDQIPGNIRHNGSRLQIAADRTLFMTTGDARSSSLAQSHSNLAGKTLRMHLDGSAPGDNPLAHYPYPYNLIYSSGHRNPQGLILTPSGRLYNSEHGQAGHDEVNLIEARRNYGWPRVQGRCDSSIEMQICKDSNIAEPLWEWTPSVAPAGIDYYDHSAIPEWRGALLLTNLRGSDLRILTLSADGRSIVRELVAFDSTWGRLRDLCVAPDGRVFISTSNRDQVGTPQVGDDRIVEVKAAQASVPINHISHSLSVVGHTLLLPWGFSDVRVDVQIIDILGRPLRAFHNAWTGADGNLSLNVASLVPGMYLVHVSDGARSQSFRLMYR